MEPKVLWRSVHRQQDEVELVGAKPPQPLRADAGPHVDPNPGAALPKPLKVPRQQIGGGGLSGSDDKSARNCPELSLGKGVRQTVDCLYQGHGEPVKALARAGEGNAWAAAFEQRNTELVFECAYLMRNGRLTRPHAFGRPREAPERGGLAERPELLEAIALPVGRRLTGFHWTRDSPVVSPARRRSRQPRSRGPIRWTDRLNDWRHESPARRPRNGVDVRRCIADTGSGQPGASRPQCNPSSKSLPRKRDPGRRTRADATAGGRRQTPFGENQHSEAWRVIPIPFSLRLHKKS